jgi:hypothetical protein
MTAPAMGGETALDLPVDETVSVLERVILAPTTSTFRQRHADRRRMPDGETSTEAMPRLRMKRTPGAARGLDEG